MATTQPEELQTHPTTGTSVPSAAGTAAPLTPSEPRPTLKDWFRFATIVIIALNVLMFVIMVAQGVSFISPTAESVLKWGADYGPLTLHGQWWRMVVSTFLHFGLIHLAFNMFVLFSIGLFMEELAGRMKLCRIPTRKSHWNRAYKGRGMQLGRASTAKNGRATDGEYKYEARKSDVSDRLAAFDPVYDAAPDERCDPRQGWDARGRRLDADWSAGACRVAVRNADARGAAVRAHHHARGVADSNGYAGDPRDVRGGNFPGAAREGRSCVSVRLDATHAWPDGDFLVHPRSAWTVEFAPTLAAH